MSSLAKLLPGLTGLPVAGIATLPTPIERVEALPAFGFEPAELLVKRDDLTSAVYGGNKVRKLDFLLADARAQGRTTVLTFGAYGSNHALATAVHARALGIEPHVVLSPQEPGPFAPKTLFAHAALGTGIHLVDGWDGRREAVAAKRELAARDGVEPYIIPMGGTCPLGALGYVNAALEVCEQVSPPDVVYVASGTFGTAIGLAVGFALAGAPTKVEAVRVTPEQIASSEIARSLAEQTVTLLRSHDASVAGLGFDDLAFTLREEFFEPGYGIVTPETTEAVSIAAGLGLRLETTYTGKAFSAMLADGRERRLDSRRVLFWNTYSSAPYPQPGPIESLPQTLRDYIAECRRMYPEEAGRA